MPGLSVRQKLAEDVRLVLEDFAAALSPEGAESIAGRVVDDTVSSMFTDAEKARVLSEDEIRELSRVSRGTISGEASITASCPWRMRKLLRSASVGFADG